MPTRSISDRPSRSTLQAATISNSLPGDGLHQLVEARALIASLGAADALVPDRRLTTCQPWRSATACSSISWFLTL